MLITDPVWVTCWSRHACCSWCDEVFYYCSPLDKAAQHFYQSPFLCLPFLYLLSCSPPSALFSFSVTYSSFPCRLTRPRLLLSSTLHFSSSHSILSIYSPPLQSAASFIPCSLSLTPPIVLCLLFPSYCWLNHGFQDPVSRTLYAFMTIVLCTLCSSHTNAWFHVIPFSVLQKFGLQQ